MLSRRINVSLVLILVLSLSFLPVRVMATESVVQQEQKIELLKQLKYLYAVLLQYKIQNSVGNRSLTTADITETNQSESFNFPHEAEYFINHLQLINQQDSKSVREIDRQMFSFFTDIVGEKFVNEKVGEWKVFYSEDPNIDAYTTPQLNSGSWIVGVNREGFDLSDSETKKSFAELFVHEYAHIVISDFPELSKDFSTIFWNQSDFLNEKNLKTIKGEERNVIMGYYYKNNSNRFVSDYATINVEEDLAETFVKFIFDSKPKGETIKEQKILAFYEEAELVKIRDEVRVNLSALKINID